MKPLRRLGIMAVAAALALPGCAGTKAPQTAPDSHTADVSAPPSPEAEVKPAPVTEAPAAAAPPLVISPEVLADAHSRRPASPDEQTKETLGTKSAQLAAVAPPRAEPAKKSPESQAPAPQVGSPSRSIAVVGDSLAVGVGMTMEQNLKKYEGLGCQPLGKVSTGLISKKFFDWEKRLTELVATEKPMAVVVVMGGNDANNPIAGKAAGTPEWSEAYGAKAESFLRIASNAGVKVLWVGLPVMREPAYAARVRAVNAAAKEACAKVGGCAYMEAGDIFADASGHYVQEKDIGGKTVPLRARDGVHMTMAGYDLLCRQVLEKLGKTVELSPGKK